MMSSASALIYTREKYIGFPGGWFKVQPENFPGKAAKAVMDYAMDAMEAVKPLRSAHEQVQVVIAQDGYVVLGIAAYLRDLFSDGWEGTDEKGRPVYGFFGYVWKQNEFHQPLCFPERKAFADLAAEYIRPNWEVSGNARWATHQELVPYQYRPCAARNENISDFEPGLMEPVEKAEQLVQWAIGKAAGGGDVSVCTNVTVYDVQDYRSAYRYVALAASGSNDTPAKRTAKAEERSDSDLVSEHEDVPPKAEPAPKNGKGAAIAWFAFGIVLLILAAISIPAAWEWKLLSVAAVACFAVGTVKLTKISRKKEKVPMTDPEVSLSQRQTAVRTEAFQTEKELKKTTVMSTPRKEKRPEDETTENLFNF